MQTKIFVNFPVTDIKASTDFYEKIGFRKSIDFSDEPTSCMIWDDNFYIMLLSLKRWSCQKMGECARLNCGESIHLGNGIPEDVMYGLEILDPDGNVN